MIKEVQSDKDIIYSVKVIKDSFAPVASAFNLTRENCPSHPSFITYEKMIEYKGIGIIFFGLFEEEEQIGFVAIERAGDSIFFMEKLSVLPAFQHRGYGKALMDFVSGYVKEQGGKKLSIAIIDKSDILKNWYLSYGFREKEKKDFKRLPFTVCFLEKAVY